jgi:hypothetical protein
MKLSEFEYLHQSLQAFFYDWLDRNAARKGKPLPDKIGSMQFFLSGFQGDSTILCLSATSSQFATDASEFLRKHPWPGRAIRDTFDDSTHRQGGVSKRFLSALKIVCGKTGAEDVYDDPDYEDESALYDATESGDADRPFYWTTVLQQSFRDELEKCHLLYFCWSL